MSLHRTLPALFSKHFSGVRLTAVGGQLGGFRHHYFTKEKGKAQRSQMIHRAGGLTDVVGEERCLSQKVTGIHLPSMADLDS